jgi:hypothetical protein
MQNGPYKKMVRHQLEEKLKEGEGGKRTKLLISSVGTKEVHRDVAEDFSECAELILSRRGILKCAEMQTGASGYWRHWELSRDQSSGL